MASGPHLDFSKKSLKSLGGVCRSKSTAVSLTADHNELSSLKGVDQLPGLLQLSVCYNKLVHISSISSLTSLVILNLQSNSITTTSGLERLGHLQWLSIAGNSVKDTRGLTQCVSLTHLDLSNNCISALDSGLVNLTALKTLLLHSNAITLLQMRSCLIPSNVEILTLAENNISNFNEFASLSHLCKLSQVSVMGNPSTRPSTRGSLNYRPYLLVWCQNITVLDGVSITATERQEAKLLMSDKLHYSSGGRSTHKAAKPPSDSITDQSFSSSIYPQSATSSSYSQPPVSKKPQVMETLRALRYVQEMIQSQEDKLLQQSTPNTRQEALKHLAHRDRGGEVREGDMTMSSILDGDSVRPAASPSLSPSPPRADSDGDSTPTLYFSSSPPTITKQRVDKLEGSEGEELLQSTSCFLPVHNNSAGSPSARSTGTLSSFTSSLSRAYGYPMNSEGVIQLSDILLGMKDGTTSSDREGATSVEQQQASATATVKELSPLVEEEIVKAVVIIQAVVRGYLCRKQNLIARHRAATVLQAAWRGRRARKKDPAVMGAREHLYHKKTENCIALLFSQLMGCREELAHQVHLQQIQEETMQSLMREVEELQQWRREQIKDQRQKAARIIQKHWRCHKSRQNQVSSSSTATASLLQSLTWNCLSLQKKVTSLEDQLTKLGEYNAQQAPVSLPPPVDLTMKHFSNTCLLIKWSPPLNTDPDMLKGYRIYVNSSPEGEVSRGKHKAYIEGLNTAVNYRITVRALYGNDLESIESNAVVAALSATPGSPCSTSEEPGLDDSLSPVLQGSNIPPLSFTIKEDDHTSPDIASQANTTSTESPAVLLVPNKDDHISLDTASQDDTTSAESPAILITPNKEDDYTPASVPTNGGFPSPYSISSTDDIDDQKHSL